MDSLTTARSIVKILDDKKAINIKMLDIRELTTMADFFIVCSGNSTTQIKAIADEVNEEMSKQGVKPIGREGFATASWVLIDYGDVIVHVFNHESRDFYSIEHLWADAKEVDISDIIED